MFWSARWRRFTAGRPTMTTGPLTGIHVLDLSRVLAGPYATMALGELGADVIKVERAPGGDETRQWGPPFVAGESTYFLGVNRNKRSIALDLGNDADRAIVQDLALSWAEVVVENFRPGTLERWNLGLSSLRERQPRLITATVRGYPSPDNRPGYDFVIQAVSGLMSITGPKDSEPSKVGVAVADIITGLFLLSGIEALLVARDRTGVGDHLDVSLFGAQWAALATVVQGYLLTGQDPQRWGNQHAQLTPYQTFASQDGWIAVGVGIDSQFAALCGELGHPEWATDARFIHNPERIRCRLELERLLQREFSTATSADWVAKLDAAGVPVGPVRTVPQALLDATEKGYGVIARVPHETLGDLPQVSLPWEFQHAQASPSSAPPRLDQHRRDILDLVESIKKGRKDVGNE